MGQLAAVFISSLRCSLVSGPVNSTVTSIRSIIPSLFRHSSQSCAWMRECVNETLILSSGNFLKKSVSASAHNDMWVEDVGCLSCSQSCSAGVHSIDGGLVHLSQSRRGAAGHFTEVAKD